MSNRHPVPSIDSRNIKADPAQWRLGCALVDEAVRNFELFKSAASDIERVADALTPQAAVSACVRCGLIPHAIFMAAAAAKPVYPQGETTNEEWWRRFGEREGLDFLADRATYVSDAYGAARRLCLAAAKLETEAQALAAEPVAA